MHGRPALRSTISRRELMHGVAGAAMVVPLAVSGRLALAAGAPPTATSTLATTSSERPVAAVTGALPRLEPLRSVRTDALEIAYFEAGPGDGEVVLLLHGFPYDIHSYVDVSPRLVAAGHRVIAPYLRGHGPTVFLDSAAPRSGQQAAIGADVVALMDALAIPRAIFAGYDWGGRAACVAAALWPERCAGLVSVNSYLIQEQAFKLSTAPGVALPPCSGTQGLLQYLMGSDRAAAINWANRPFDGARQKRGRCRGTPTTVPPNCAHCASSRCLPGPRVSFSRPLRIKRAAISRDLTVNRKE